MDTEPLAAIPLLSPPFNATVDEAAAAAGSMFWDAMCAHDPVAGGEKDGTSMRHTATQKDKDTGPQLSGGRDPPLASAELPSSLSGLDHTVRE